MKSKITTLLFIVFILIINFNFTICYSNSTTYARINKNNQYLYKTPSSVETYDNIICFLENTYFVEILNKFDSFYQVNYNNLIGYVKFSSVSLVLTAPQSPYPTANIKTVESNCNLRSTPEVLNKPSNTLTIIPANSTNIIYYGKIYGDEAIDFSGNTWYYVNYMGVSGYVYSSYIKNISSIYPNIEEINYINSLSTDIEINPLSNPSCVIIIILISLPALFIVYFLYKSPKVKIKKKNSQKTKFENIEKDFDEDYL